MTTVSTCVLTLALIISLTNGKILRGDGHRSIFMSSEPDPYLDSYTTTITRLSIKEIMALPKLSDSELMDQVAQGYDSLPALKNDRSASNLFDGTTDELLEVKPDIENEWEDLMEAGPTSINLMGSVMAIASKKDFALNSAFNYKLIKYPKSFKATLMQTSHDMHRALYGAHTSMESIQVSMKQIPALLKTALKLITQGSTSLSKAVLPRTLASIGRCANDSAAAARASLDRFESLQALLQEILEVTTYTSKEYKDKADQLAAESLKMTIEKKEMDDIVANIAAQYQAARSNLERAQQEYHTAMKYVPGDGWDSHAWDVYASQRPAETCSRNWIGRRSCRSLRSGQFTEYTAEARYKAEQALNILKDAETHSKNIYNIQMNKQDQLTATINSLANLNFNEISVNETTTILLNATRKIALFHSQWSRISRFFSTLAISTEYTQQVLLQNFLGAISDMELISKDLDPIDKTLFLVLLVESATDIDRDSHRLYLMAKTYFDVSNKYMMDQIAGLSGALELQNDNERNIYLKQVANTSEAISTQIRALATERQSDYELANLSRQEEYMKFIQQGILEEVNNLNNIGIGRR